MQNIQQQHITLAFQRWSKSRAQTSRPCPIAIAQSSQCWTSEWSTINKTRSFEWQSIWSQNAPQWQWNTESFAFNSSCMQNPNHNGILTRTPVSVCQPCSSNASILRKMWYRNKPWNLFVWSYRISRSESYMLLGRLSRSLWQVSLMQLWEEGRLLMGSWMLPHKSKRWRFLDFCLEHFNSCH